MTVNEIAEALNITTGKCRRAIAELEAQGTVKSIGITNRGQHHNFKDYPAETIDLVNAWTIRKVTYKTDFRNVVIDRGTLKPSQILALNLLKYGIGLGNIKKAPRGFISRLIDGIHRGEIKA